MQNYKIFRISANLLRIILFVPCLFKFFPGYKTPYIRCSSTSSLVFFHKIQGYRRIVVRNLRNYVFHIFPFQASDACPYRGQSDGFHVVGNSSFAHVPDSFLDVFKFCATSNSDLCGEIINMAVAVVVVVHIARSVLPSLANLSVDAVHGRELRLELQSNSFPHRSKAVASVSIACHSFHFEYIPLRYYFYHIFAFINLIELIFGTFFTTFNSCTLICSRYHYSFHSASNSSSEISSIEPRLDNTLNG